MYYRFRSTSIAQVTAAFVICVAALSQPAPADPMTAKSLAENLRACMTACSKRTGGDARCDAYCDCGTQGLAERMTEEEYQAGVSAIANKQRPAEASIQKAFVIAQSCAAKLQ
jgi:uncharacterized membrane protein